MTDTPRHIGIIMDGNRRWAKEKGLGTKQGHLQGQKNLQRISKVAFEAGAKYVTVYAFSTENWQRAQDEVKYLMGLLVKGVDKYVGELHKAGIKIKFIGDKNALDKAVLGAIQKSEQTTAGNTRGVLAICFNYGGQQEIVHAVRQIVESGAQASEVTEETISNYLYAPEIPPVDLVVRTSGEQRLSNFMLWRTAYSELYFTNKYWPDFSPEDLQIAIDEYQHRKRRFGK